MMNERLPEVDDVHSERFRTVVSLGRRSFRRRRGLLRVEGPQALRELFEWKPEAVRDIYFTREAAQRYADLWDKAGQLTRHRYWLSAEIARDVLPETQGVVGVCKLDAVVADSSSVFGAERGPLVVLPETQDPGNAGTIIRTADSFGAAGLVSCVGSVDVTNPKVIRTSVGSVFHIPIIQGLTFEQVVPKLRSSGRHVYGTSGAPTATSVEDVDLTVPHAWIFGNEAQGLSAAEEMLCDTLVRVPMTGQSESLNVATAASICLFYSQQRGG